MHRRTDRTTGDVHVVWGGLTDGGDDGPQLVGESGVSQYLTHGLRRYCSIDVVYF